MPIPNQTVMNAYVDAETIVGDGTLGNPLRAGDALALTKLATESSYVEDYAGDFTVTTTTTGAASQGIGAPEQGRPGIYLARVQDLATADRAAWSPAGSGLGNSIVIGGGEIQYVTSLRLDALSTAAQAWMLRGGGLDSQVADAIDGVYFENDRSVHGDNNWRGCCASNNVRTKLSLGVAPTANVWTKLAWRANAAGTLITFLVDGIARGEVSTNIPNVQGRHFGWTYQFVKTVGNGTAFVTNVDYWGFSQRPTVSR